MNPLNNSGNNFAQFVSNIKDPQQWAQQLLQQNPQARQALERLQNVTHNQHPKTIAMQLAQEKGISPEQLMQLANKLGLK